MILRSLIKLIDEAIIPAVGLIVVKMLSIFLITYFTKVLFTVEHGKVFLLPLIQFNNPTDYFHVENWSNLAMLLFVVAGNFLLVFKAHFFHLSHIHPTLDARITRLNLRSIVTSSYHLYHQAVIWLLFLWLMEAFLFISSLLKITNWLITIIGLLFAINLTWILISDIENEIKHSKADE